MSHYIIRAPRKLHPSNEPATPPGEPVQWALVGYKSDGRTLVPALDSLAPTVRAKTWFEARAALAGSLPSKVSTQDVEVALADGRSPE